MKSDSKLEDIPPAMWCHYLQEVVTVFYFLTSSKKMERYCPTARKHGTLLKVWEFLLGVMRLEKMVCLNLSPR